MRLVAAVLTRLEAEFGLQKLLVRNVLQLMEAGRRLVAVTAANQTTATTTKDAAGMRGASDMMVPAGGAALTTPMAVDDPISCREDVSGREGSTAVDVPYRGSGMLDEALLSLRMPSYGGQPYAVLLSEHMQTIAYVASKQTVRVRLSLVGYAAAAVEW